MKITHTPLIPEVIVFEPEVHGDTRGFFVESFRDTWFAEAGLAVTFVQDNHSRSRRHTLRGLHWQDAHPQGKLVRVTHGAVLDVAVDIRRGSPTFGAWVSRVLDDKTHHQLWIPPGFAHGFLVLSDEADFCYRCTDYYDPRGQCGIRFDDPRLGIAWPLDAQEPILSEKDRNLPFVDDLPATALPTIPHVALQKAAS
ncbi:MAG TPA: dTDP-4-dehydrorhamnose 3,5-epimerase [Alphaproteobacteria bacterium]|nr:dTDP-4-dehydrorhamnose 3,5-epimerase [Alphaproteobacteria bacterium]